MDSLQSTTDSILLSSLSDLLTLSTSEGWESLNPEKGVSGFQKSQDGRLNLIKAVGTLNFPVDQVLSFMLNSSYKWDETLEESRVLHEFSADLFLMYERYKCPWPVSDRDFVYGMKILKREEAFYIIAKSIETSHPLTKGVVRGEIVTSGYILKRTESNFTELTYLVSLDPKGSIPAMIVRSLNKSQVSNIWRIREFMQKLYN